MAIDDNTIYGLYGSQIKDLPEKIKEVEGKAKVLSTADYNWPTTGTKTGIAIWLLPPGVYARPYGSTISAGTYLDGNSLQGADENALFIVTPSNSSQVSILTYVPNKQTSSVWRTTSYSTGASYSAEPLITSVINNLTTPYYQTGRALDAYQGKVLNDKIGNLTTLTTTAKTSAVAAINELDSDLAGKQSELTPGDNITITDESGDLVISATQEQADWSQTNSAAADYIKNKPTIPTVGNGTITFTNNGTTVGSFTANATADTTVALSAPVITMQASDPGEGVALAANNFIAVYDAS